MKIIVIIMLASVMFLFASAHSESEIPISIKNNAEKILQKGYDHGIMISILEDMAREKILPKAVYEDTQFHTLPEEGKPLLVKISGQINDYGKTGPVSLTIVKPDNSREVIQTPLLETGKYVTYFPVDSSFQRGLYTVLAHFGSQNMTSTYFRLGNDSTTTSIPLWFKTNFQWWVEQKITDKEFLNSVRFLIDQNLINIVIRSDPQPSGLQIFVQGDQMVRRGTTHTIVSHITDGPTPIEGAKVTLRIEDYGEDVIREFEGFTNSDGDFIFSWEVPKSFDDLETLLAFISVTNGESSKTTLFKFQVYCLPGESQCKIEGN